MINYKFITLNKYYYYIITIIIIIIIIIIKKLSIETYKC